MPVFVDAGETEDTTAPLEPSCVGQVSQRSPEGCVLGKSLPNLELAEPELAELALVAERLEPEPARFGTESNRTELAVSENCNQNKC